MTGIGRLAAALCVAAGALAAAPAAADWRLYGAGEAGYSILDASAGGVANIAAGPQPLRGSDTDVSPLVSLSLGVAVPIDEALPRRMTGRNRLPDWPLRFEIEGVGVRDYDLRTSAIVPANQTGPIHTEIRSWAAMGNVWLDLPTRALYGPISWTSARLFGRWRLPTLKRTLDRTTFDVGLGIGVAGLHTKVREADARGTEDAYNFAWQAGAGFGYRLTERVKLTVGYRYFDPGDVKIGLAGGGLQGNNSYLKLDNDIHEARVGVRVLFDEFESPFH